MVSQEEQRKILIELAMARMPFGKYKDKLLVEIPEPYYVWFSQKGFPPGKLGQQMALMYEIKINGQEALIHQIRKQITNK